MIAWTPEDEGTRRGEKRKGKKGNVHFFNILFVKCIAWKC